jgi:hypothetical protein
MTTSSDSANAYGAQMAKYFTMNQPPHVAIDSAVSVVRPQLAITRLIARSGIPERTASIPSEKAYVVSVHLNREFRGMGTLDRREVHKDRCMASGRSRNVRPGVKFEYSKSRLDRLDSLPCSACNVGFPHGRCRNAES